MNPSHLRIRSPLAAVALSGALLLPACRHASVPAMARSVGDQRVRTAPVGGDDRCADPEVLAHLHRTARGGGAPVRWDTASVQRRDGGTVYDLRFVSQRWQGIEWEHHLHLLVPAGAANPDLALLVLRDGTPGALDVSALQTISRETGAAAAVLYQVPNQPAFGGLEEDPLLAHTFSQYLRTGDASWPLLFPMTRSVVAAMDVVQALSAQQGGRAIARYVVAGHSKRGQTAWLSAAADPRVAGIIPLASNVLNSPAQIAHHRAVAGEITGASGVFDETIRAADTPRGRCLIAMIDPYSYRDRISAPKLLVLGTNDDYTPADALELYWAGLHGEKSVLYLPNTAHAPVSAHGGVNPSAFAFVRAVGSRTAMPVIASALDVRGGALELRASTNVPAGAGRLWSASSRSRDFRAARWTESPMTADPAPRSPRGGAFLSRVPLPTSGYSAHFAELELQVGGAPFKLSTQIHVVEGRTR